MTKRKRTGLEQIRRGAYFTQRGIGDYQAYRRGRLPARLVRRAGVSRLMRILSGH